MSLEIAITNNTAALQALTEAWNSLTRNAGIAAGLPPPSLTVAGLPLAANAAPAVAVAKPDAPVAEVVAETIAYAAVGAAITAYAVVHGRDATLAVLGKLGVSSGKTLKPEQFAQALDLFTQEVEVA